MQNQQHQQVNRFWCRSSNMSKPAASKAKPVEDFVVTQHGSGPFRAFNFELYAVCAP